MTPGVVFDLDGTLVDSILGISASMNASLLRHGRPAHPVAAYKQFIGDGVEMLAARALGLGFEAQIAAVAATFRRIYAERMMEGTAPFAGISDVVASLAAAGAPLAVLSNKPHVATVTMVEALFGKETFRAIVGQRPDVPKKPHPGEALRIAGVSVSFRDAVRAT